MLKQILGALKDHSEKMDKQFEHLNNRIDGLELRIDNLESRMDKLESRMDNMELRMETGFDQLGKKFDGMRVELTETRETTDFVLSKTAQHEKKLHQFENQHY
ncbi:hypothetical protein [Virgibacillus kimchii]